MLEILAPVRILFNNKNKPLDHSFDSVKSVSITSKVNVQTDLLSFSLIFIKFHAKLNCPIPYILIFITLTEQSVFFFMTCGVTIFPMVSPEYWILIHWNSKPTFRIFHHMY